METTVNTAARHTSSSPVPASWRPGDSSFAERYRAIDARDHRFDGQFFTAVSSTGVYCRPSCPAKTPKVENVVFYPTSAAAQDAGFRACKRCFPEATPGTPEWNVRQDLAAQAMRLILDGVVDREGVGGLARKLGYTTRHLHRVLVSQLGAGPLSLARARRAQSARALLVGSDLPVADVAFAAGFGSIRQFNLTMQEVFASPPGELRTRFGSRKTGHSLPSSEAGQPAPSAVQLGIDLPVRQPFDAPGIFSFLAARAVAGVESTELGDPNNLVYSRTLALPGGPGAFQVTAHRDSHRGWALRAELELARLQDLTPAVSRIRRLLDLDADPHAVDEALSRDPALRPSVQRTPGIRVPGTVDPHEVVIRAIIGQQISVKAARTHLTRLAAAAGASYHSRFDGLSRLFPTPEDVLKHVPEPVADEPLDPHRILKLPRRSITTVLGVARALDSGELLIGFGNSPQTQQLNLLQTPGIGPWTAAYLSMRVLGDPNTWMRNDVALVAGAARLGILDPLPSASATHRALEDYAQRWSPWRSYASMHLWQAA